ncbi:MAG: hypothetical protein JNM45_12065 [Rhizobiales bacterium]|nr:hypothetical protein [Hyphomicrobiales bacterium]
MLRVSKQPSDQTKVSVALVLYAIAMCATPLHGSLAFAQTPTTSNQLNSPALNVRIVEQPPTTPSDLEQQKQSLQRDKDDLVAQQTMANGTTYLVWITGAQFALTLIGTALLFFTLRLNREATNAAVTANATTRLAVDQEQANSKRQLRAYVLVDTIEFIQGGQHDAPKVKLIARNYGQTPADQVQIVLMIDQTLTDNEEKHSVGSEEFEVLADSKAPMGPDASLTLETKARGPLNQHDLQSLYGGTKPIYAFGRINYVDCFNQKQFTEFRFRTARAELSGISSTMLVCAKGNSYSHG